MSGQYLSDQDFAELYAQANDVIRGEDVLDIEPKVQAWLDRHDMAHRSAFSIAVQVSKLKPAPVRVPSSEQAAAAADVSEGFGPRRELTAEAIAAMDLHEFGELRKSLGIGASGAGILDPIGG